ncbi:MAG: hypothetical protein JRF65_16205, partial [Deltaproteobacteria bacterium]|nr:hypothetical protein [Deltaproteobacteria bacterium]
MKPDPGEAIMENAGAGNAGFKKLMYGYNGQRVGASAVALGIAHGAHDLAIDWMKRRKAFGLKLLLTAWPGMGILWLYQRGCSHAYEDS